MRGEVGMLDIEIQVAGQGPIVVPLRHGHREVMFVGEVAGILVPKLPDGVEIRRFVLWGPDTEEPQFEGERFFARSVGLFQICIACGGWTRIVEIVVVPNDPQGPSRASVRDAVNGIDRSEWVTEFLKRTFHS